MLHHGGVRLSVVLSAASDIFGNDVSQCGASQLLQEALSIAEMPRPFLAIHLSHPVCFVLGTDVKSQTHANAEILANPSHNG